MSVRTADGTSRAALRPSRHSPVDLLERAGLAMGPRQLLDDERHAFGLGVHRGRGRRLDRAAEDALQELGRLDRR